MPAPGELLSRAAKPVSTVHEQARLLYGADLSPDLPHIRAGAVEHRCRLRPDWPRDSVHGNEILAVAYYTFDMAGFNGTPVVTLDWAGTAPDAADQFIGLANLERGCWEWYPALAASFDLEPCLDESQQLLMAVVLLGTLESELNCVIIGEPYIVAGVDLTRMYAPPLEFETQAVEDGWLARDLSVNDYTVVADEWDDDFFRTLVVSHTVDGQVHYGLVRVPPYGSLDSFGVLVYCHAGTNGAYASDLFNLDHIWINSDKVADSCVIIMPSFRSEMLDAGSLGMYASEGEPGRYDRDTDDALVLLRAVLAAFNSADPDRIAVMGMSRGAQVAQRMAQRDHSILAVVDLYGMTDEWLPALQDDAAELLAAAEGGTDITGFAWGAVLDGLRLGTADYWDARNHLLRTSTLYYPDRLPRVQIHHGTADTSISVLHSDRLADVLAQTPGADFEYFRYEGGTHSPGSLDGSAERIRTLLEDVLEL